MYRIGIVPAFFLIALGGPKYVGAQPTEDEVVDMSGMIDMSEPEATVSPVAETDDAIEDLGDGDVVVMTMSELIDLKVVSASKEEESVDDAPSPVTVITSRMIEQSGAKTLRELLTLYVPGMTFVQDQNETNVAMRGVYGSAQQKILILQDGHRLNNRAYAAAPPDFGISLEKVKQIEVLRGPGSSLYGNIALTGVINIVTKSGEDLQGGQVSATIGSFGERKVSALFGKSFQGFDLIVWSAIYTADGETVSIPNDEDYSVVKSGNAKAIIGGFSDTPAYDVGMRLVSGDLTIFAANRSVKYTEPFTGGGSPTGQSYDYDKFRPLLGVGPGMRFDFSHLGITYDKKVNDKFSFSVNPYADHSTMYVHLVLNPATNTSAAPTWSEYGLGATVQGKLKYNVAGSGTLTFGGQVDHMNLYDSFFPRQTQAMGQTESDWSDFADTRGKKVLGPGKETTSAGFVQVRHKVNDEVLLNVGGRVDVKRRFNDANVADVSPRLAVVYNPKKEIANGATVSIKGSFARSFVDAPYWYRNNSLGSYRGGVDLKPEHLTSVQVTPTLKLMDGRFRYSLNGYYNELTDFIWRNNEAAADEPIYQNAGFLKSYGVENEITFVHPNYEIRTNFTYQASYKADNYGVKGKEIFNIPKFTGALILDATPFSKYKNNFHTNVSLRYMGSQLSPISGGIADDPDFRLPQVLLVDLGVSVADLGWKGWKLGANVYNAVGTRWKHGGSVQNPYPQNGRWLSLTASHKL